MRSKRLTGLRGVNRKRSTNDFGSAKTAPCSHHLIEYQVCFANVLEIGNVLIPRPKVLFNGYLLTSKIFSWLQSLGAHTHRHRKEEREKKKSFPGRTTTHTERGERRRERDTEDKRETPKTRERHQRETPEREERKKESSQFSKREEVSVPYCPSCLGVPDKRSLTYCSQRK
jgi:hypothetical protein